MNARTLLLLLAVTLTIPFFAAVPAAIAAGPVIARGAQREAIKSQHILDRPNRPLHFYGNTARRRHVRGQ